MEDTKKTVVENDTKIKQIVPEEKQLYTIDEAIKIIPMTRSGLYLACRKKKVPCVYVASRVFIPAWYIRTLTQQKTVSINE